MAIGTHCLRATRTAAPDETARVAAEEVGRQTGALQREIDTFLSTVRAA